jgi:hypothetical protein
MSTAAKSFRYIVLPSQKKTITKEQVDQAIDELAVSLGALVHVKAGDVAAKFDAAMPDMTDTEYHSIKHFADRWLHVKRVAHYANKNGN